MWTAGSAAFSLLPCMRQASRAREVRWCMGGGGKVDGAEMGFRSLAASRSASRSPVCNRLELACERRLLSVHTEETKGAPRFFASTIKFLEADGEVAFGHRKGK
jgi:hypothetical protein